MQIWGYNNVVTYINSGNVIFETKDVNESKIVVEIEKMIEKEFQLSIRVLIRSYANITKICKKVPKTWVNNAEHKTDVMFLWNVFADKKTLAILEKNDHVDTLMYVNGAIIWHLKKSDYSKSGMQKIVGTEIYKNMTVRNINTVRKLGALMV